MGFPCSSQGMIDVPIVVQKEGEDSGVGLASSGMGDFDGSSDGSSVGESGRGGSSVVDDTMVVDTALRSVAVGSSGESGLSGYKKPAIDTGEPASGVARV